MFQHVDQRVRHLQSSIAKLIPIHSLLPVLPAVAEEAKSYGCLAISSLAAVASEACSGLDKQRASAVAASLVAFFADALKFRQTVEDEEEEDVECAENELINAFLSFALKLPLDDFKPVFYRIFNAPHEVETNPTAAKITAFHLASAAAKKLRSLFDFALESLAQKTIAVLKEATNESVQGDKVILVFKALSSLSAALENSRGLTAGGGGSSVDGGDSDDSSPQLTGKAYEELTDALLATFEVEAGSGKDDVIREEVSEHTR